MIRVSLAKELKTRIARAVRAMRAVSTNSALIVSSATKKQRARDLSYPFYQDNDFYYLTGSALENCNLVIFSNSNKSLLIAPKITEHQLLWEGAGERAGAVAKRIGATILESDDPIKEFKKTLSEVQYIYYPNSTSQAGYESAKQLLATPSYIRKTPAPYLAHTDLVLESLRLQKSPFEVAKIKEAIEIGQRALNKIKDLIKPGVSEWQLSLALRHAIEAQGTVESFPAIVAAGENGAILHHTPSDRKLKSGELLTVDFGAMFEGYAADVTRVFHVGDKPLPYKHLELYEMLRQAQADIIKKIKPGVSWKALHEKMELSLLLGLKDLGLVKGSIKKLTKDRAIKKFFPHSLGHSLGLAVHDIGPLRMTADTKLAAGMVVTVEPGLYSARKIGKVPPFGMRIEDDVLVTKTGAVNLSEKVSKSLK